MIKQIWTVRSVTKLFDGLNFTITFFMLGYTILNILFLPNDVPSKINNAGNMIAYQSKFILLVLPIISTIICVLLHIFSSKIKSSIVTAKSTNRSIVDLLKVKYESLIGFNFIIMLLSFFLQLNFLNKAKEMKEFSPIIIIAIIISLIIFIIYQIKRIIKLK